jgi:anti-sigma factor RsiW
MCPDRDLISAYVDGEVPSPWRERLEEHFASCSDCAALLTSYSGLGERLRADSVEEPAAEAAAVARGRSRLDALLAGRPELLSPARRPSRLFDPSVWRRSVSLPLPLALAAALLVLFLGGAASVLAFKPSVGRVAIQTVASSEIAPPPMGAQQAQPASMDELLRYLSSGDGQVTLTINLPTGTTFGSAGKPVIMRAGRAVKGMTVGGSAP